jgi:hypothetical protein
MAGSWSTKGTRAESDLDGSERAQVRAVSCADCSVQAKVVNFGVGFAALDLRVHSGGDRYDVALFGTGRLQIRRWRAGVATVLGDVASGIAELRNWSTISLSATGSSPVQLVASVNGVPRLSAADSSGSAITDAGTAGISTNLAGIWFDAFAVTGASAPVPPPPPPPPPPAPGTVLFQDDFNRTLSLGLGPSWTVAAGAWLTNNKANSGLNQLDRALISGVTCADCRIAAKMVNFGGGESMLELRASGSDRYALVLSASGALQIRRYSGGAQAVLGSVPSGISELRAWHSFGFSAQGTAPVTLIGSVDGVPKLTVTDTDSSALTGAGAAGIAATFAGIWFDDFVLEPLP